MKKVWYYGSILNESTEYYVVREYIDERFYLLVHVSNEKDERLAVMGQCFDTKREAEYARMYRLIDELNEFSEAVRNMQFEVHSIQSYLNSKD